MHTQITYQDQSVGTQPLVKYWMKTADNTKYLFTRTKPDRHLETILGGFGNSVHVYMDVLLLERIITSSGHTNV